jgi:hypothetical protein
VLTHPTLDNERQPQLARAAADQLPGHHRPDHLDHHQHRAEGLRPPGPDRLHKVKVTKEQIAAVNITASDWHPEWNYRITPANHSP